ncbi:LamG domain-containing protein [archaeon]|jgi:hypothetical protein|nr:LamG domain-containing protein [archaeon]
MKYKKLNKSAVSLMISYVLLISIVLALSVGVFSWLKIMADVSPEVDCKDDTSLIILDYTCNPDPGEGIVEGIDYDTDAGKFSIKNLKLDLKNNGRFNIDGVIVTVGPTDSTPSNYLAPEAEGGKMNGHYYFESPLEPQTEKTISFINQEYAENNLILATNGETPSSPLATLGTIEIQPFIITKEDKHERILCKNAVKKIQVEDCTIIGDVATIPKPIPIEIPDPVAHWKFEEYNSNSKIEDLAGDNDWRSKLDYYPNIDTENLGKVGNGAWFDGINDNLKMSSPVDDPILGLDIGPDNEITISAWIKTTSSTKQGIIKRGTGGSALQNQEYALYLDGGEIHFSIGDGSDSVSVSGDAISQGDWYHVVGIVDSDYIKIHINGNSPTQESRSSVDNAPGFTLQNLGSLNSEHEYTFNGFIDEVKIWSTSLTPEQVTAEYESYSFKDPVAYYNFNEGGGTRIDDSKGNNNDYGTITDGTWDNSDYVSGTSSLKIGESGYIEIHETQDLDISITDAYTISGWFKLEPGELSKNRYFWIDYVSGISGYSAIIFGGDQDFFYYNTDKDSNGDDHFRILGNIQGLSEFTVDWHHLVQQAYIENGKVMNRVYIDNALKSPAIHDAVGLVSDSTGNLKLAEDLDGLIDEVIIWDYALSPQQITALYNSY